MLHISFIIWYNISLFELVLSTFFKSQWTVNPRVISDSQAITRRFLNKYIYTYLYLSFICKYIFTGCLFLKIIKNENIIFLYMFTLQILSEKLMVSALKKYENEAGAWLPD